MKLYWQAILSVVLQAFLILHSYAASAEWCSHRAGIPVEDAYEKASLIFYGKLDDMWGMGFPDRSALDHKNGRFSAVTHCDPYENTPYDPKKDCGFTYQARFEVLQTFKDTRGLVKGTQVQVNVYNRYSGFQFEWTVDGYLVYAWDRTADLVEAPWASLCARTRPRRYASDDVRYLKKKLNIKLHQNLEFILE